MDSKIIIRFEAKFERRDDGGCWNWRAGAIAGRYGGFRFYGWTQLAHRVSWRIYRGPIPEGMCVLHKCDNTWCVNPSHLFLGTQVENIEDMVSKRRHTRKLTEDAVRKIRADDRKQWKVAYDYDVSQAQISNIKRGLFWREVV